MSMESGDVATWAGLEFSLLTGLAAVKVYFELKKRERRQALTELHASLTSGETAHARNTIGTLLYSPDPENPPERLDCIGAYFALIWALQRARNVFRTYDLPWEALGTPQREIARLVRDQRRRDALLALSWNLAEIAHNVVHFHDEYSPGWQVEDVDAWDEIASYVDAAQIRIQREGSPPTNVGADSSS